MCVHVLVKVWGPSIEPHSKLYFWDLLLKSCCKCSVCPPDMSPCVSQDKARRATVLLKLADVNYLQWPNMISELSAYHPGSVPDAPGSPAGMILTQSGQTNIFKMDSKLCRTISFILLYLCNGAVSHSHSSIILSLTDRWMEWIRSDFHNFLKVPKGTFSPSCVGKHHTQPRILKKLSLF